MDSIRCIRLRQSWVSTLVNRLDSESMLQKTSETLWFSHFQLKGYFFFGVNRPQYISMMYQKMQKYLFRRYVFHIFRFFDSILNKIMISGFWKYNENNGVPLIMIFVFKKIKNTHKIVVILHFLIYCWDILMLFLSQTGKLIFFRIIKYFVFSYKL